MKDINRTGFFALLVAVLAGCNGDTATETSATEMLLPTDIRQIAAIEYSEVYADIIVNGGATQSFRMSGGDSVIVDLADVVSGEINGVAINWYELTEDVRLELATQNGSFLANPGSVFDAEYVSARFDADGDGLSNLSERIGDSCPWLYCAADGRSLVNPQDVTGITGVTTDRSVEVIFSLSADNLWQEDVSPDNLAFSWSATNYTATSIFLQDNQRCAICEPYRGWLMEINLATGNFTFDYNDDVREPILLYRIDDLSF